MCSPSVTPISKLILGVIFRIATKDIPRKWCVYDQKKKAVVSQTQTEKTQSGDITFCNNKDDICIAEGN